MELVLEQIRDQQKESWNKFSPGWKKWDELTMDFLKPMGDEIIRVLSPKKEDMILDIASGTGEPGFSLANIAVNGKVILTDISNGMLEIANEKAKLKGTTNIETVVCDVSELPFPDNYFDAVSCRMGFMFFPDMLLAAKEMHRVLKTGGKFATTVWDGPEKNFWVAVIMGTIKENMDLPAPAADAPGMFRCSNSNEMASLFNQAGFKNIEFNEIPGKMKSETADNYWNMMTEIGAPIVAALSKADEMIKEKTKTEVFDKIAKKFPDGNVIIDSGALLFYAEK